MTKTIRVLLADDHPLIRAGIRTGLATEPDIALVGEATNGVEIQSLLQQLVPDVLVLDLHMPGPPPMEMVAAIRTNYPAVKVLVLTAYDDDTYIRALVAAGVAGYVLKDEAIEVIASAIGTVAQGNMWFSQPVVMKLARWKTDTVGSNGSANLTDRELEVVGWLVAGKTDQEIGQQMGIAERTVRYCLRNIYDKLGVDTRIGAAVRATRLRLVQESATPPKGD